MNVLHISLKPVYPQVDGGCTAMANFLELLHETFTTVDHICIATPKHPFFASEYNEYLPSNVKLISHFYIDTTIKKRNFLCSLGRKIPYQTERFYTPEMANYLAEIAKNYDVVFLESAFLLPYLKHLTKAKKVFVRTHNAEFKIWETKAKTTKNGLNKIVFKRLTNQMKHYELSGLSQTNGLIHISSKDEQTFQNLLPNVPQLTISLALNDTDFVAPKADFNANEWGFLGAISWQPNEQAIETLKKTLFPALQTKFSQAKLFIAGFGTDKLTVAHSNCTILGTVADLGDFYNKISVFLAPLESGSGLKIKVVQAISQGKIVIGSAIAFEGLEFLPHKKIAHSLEDYVLELEKIQHNSIVINELKAQQDALKQHFGKQVLISKLKQFVH